MKKKNFMIIGAAAVLLAATLISGTMASFQAETTSKNKISAGNIGIQLMEETANGGKEIKEGDIKSITGMPGDKIPEAIYVDNIKDNPLYLRVTLHKSWEDRSGEKNPEADANYISIITNQKDDWIIQADDENGEEMYFYYRKPLNEKESTSKIMDFIQIANIPSKEQNLYTGLSIALDVEADAIQVIGAADAMLSEWGLEVKIDENGVLQEVEEE